MDAILKYSVIIPVYNRPNELDELLNSLVQQSKKYFEVIIVEDGSQITSRSVYEKYTTLLDLQYIYKANSGPGPSRNAGFERASGQYFVVFDSDCILPANYFESVDTAMSIEQFDAWGGPDKGHPKFTSRQQAMCCTMSMFLTTGGIRGKQNVTEFQPRSFNMGFHRNVFEVTKGFNFDRQAEDIELSIRIKQAGFKIKLIPEAFVFHKRRETWSEFFRQVHGFGRGRVKVGRVHPNEIKLTHWMPTIFLIAFLSLIPLIIINIWLGRILALLIIMYFVAVFFEGYVTTRSFKIAWHCIASTFIQLTGYGLGFLREKLA